MILTLKDIGKIKEARVELNGITVIAGENNTGKSTVGKTLFSIFNSFYKIDKKIQRERSNSLSRNILRIIESEDTNTVNNSIIKLNINSFANNLLRDEDKYKENIDLLNDAVMKFLMRNDYNFKKDIIGAIHKDIVKHISELISLKETEILKIVLFKKLQSEFNGQINNIYSNEGGAVELEIKGRSIHILIESNVVKEISDKFSLNTEAIYIDDPFILDEIRYISSFSRVNRSDNHREHLISKLNDVKRSSEVEDVISEMITSNKIGNILSKINTICDGDMIKSKDFNTGYRNKNSEEVINIKNTSTGLKTFIILKTLLLNGDLEENGTIILDEPEIHLHPEWQILFAEIIVLLQKEFNMHILLNTHSPYFLRAIQIYSAKHEIADKCKYYMAENIEDNQAIIKDVTTDIDEIYKKLAKPFEILENERYSNE